MDELELEKRFEAWFTSEAIPVFEKNDVLIEEYMVELIKTSWLNGAYV